MQDDIWLWQDSATFNHRFVAFHQWQRAWLPVGGIYIFAAHSQNHAGGRQALPLYIGKTADFSARPGNGESGHERFAEAMRKGMTHVHAMCLTDAEERSKIEQRLIARWKPQMNDQHVSAPAFTGALARGLAPAATPSSALAAALLGVKAIPPAPAVGVVPGLHSAAAYAAAFGVQPASTPNRLYDLLTAKRF